MSKVVNQTKKVNLYRKRRLFQLLMFLFAVIVIFYYDLDNFTAFITLSSKFNLHINGINI